MPTPAFWDSGIWDDSLWDFIAGGGVGEETPSTGPPKSGVYGPRQRTVGPFGMMRTVYPISDAEAFIMTHYQDLIVVVQYLQAKLEGGKK
jgi:hypothetical protein